MKSSQHIITGDSFTLAGAFLGLSEINTFDVSVLPTPDRSFAYVYGYGEYFLDRDSVAPLSIPDTIPASPGGNGNWILKNNSVDDKSNWIRKIFEAQTPESLTYADLTTLVSNSQLIAGKTYSITDYQTKHDISGTGVIFTGSTEPLVVMASNFNTFYPFAFSPSNPYDHILYEFNDTLCEDGLTPRNGFILGRENTIQNIKAKFDFREHVARWYAYDPATTQAWSSATSYSALNSTVIANIAGANCLLGCTISHVSTGTFSDDYNNSLWVILVHDVVANKYICPNDSSVQLGAFSINANPADFQDVPCFSNIAGSSNINLGFNTSGFGVMGRIRLIGSVTNLNITSYDSIYLNGATHCDIIASYGIVSTVSSSKNNRIFNSSSVTIVGSPNVTLENSTSCSIGDSCNRISIEICIGTVISQQSVDVEILKTNNTIALQFLTRARIISSVNPTIGQSITDLFMSNASNPSVGDYNNNISIINSDAVVGNSCYNVSLIDSTGALIGINANDVSIKKSVNATIGTDAVAIKILESDSVQIGDSCLYIDIIKSTSANIGNGCQYITFIDTPTSNIGINCLHNILINSINTTFGDSCSNNRLENANAILFGNSCIENSLINSPGNTFAANCKGNFWTGVSGKTVNGTFEYVTITIGSTVTATYNNNYSNVTISLKSPDNSLWYTDIDNTGTTVTYTKLQ